MTTTNQLTKAAFDHGANLFGIRTLQTRTEDFIHNGWWFNGNGEKIGYGDLCRNDLVNISQGLYEGELFIVLYEDDSRHGQEHPLDYVVEHAVWVISRKSICKVFRSERPSDSVGVDGRFCFNYLSPEGVINAILS